MEDLEFSTFTRWSGQGWLGRSRRNRWTSGQRPDHPDQHRDQGPGQLPPEHDLAGHVQSDWSQRSCRSNCEYPTCCFL